MELESPSPVAAAGATTPTVNVVPPAETVAVALKPSTTPVATETAIASENKVSAPATAPLSLEQNGLMVKLVAQQKDIVEKLKMKGDLKPEEKKRYMESLKRITGVIQNMMKAL